MTVKTPLLDQSLCMLKGISPATECTLRHRGVVMKSQLAARADTLFSAKQATQIKNSHNLLTKTQQYGLLDGLVQALPCGHRVRALHDFRQTAAFLDLETDGLSAKTNITCISILMNDHMTTFVREKNLDDFLELWAACGIIVTFNGKRFDVPIILHHYNLATVPAHIDLLEEAAHFGFRGGLKNIAAQMGFSYRDNTCTSGKDAITMWNEYKKHDNPNALSQLIAYNQDDVYALRTIYKKLLQLSLENTLIAI